MGCNHKNYDSTDYICKCRIVRIKWCSKCGAIQFDNTNIWRKIM
jgi:hypothetical protein